MKFVIVLITLAVATQAFLQTDPSSGLHCLHCCGPLRLGCCQLCGLTNNPKRKRISKRSVLSAKKFVDDLNNGLNHRIWEVIIQGHTCLDCCGERPCCDTCGIPSSTFKQYYPNGVPDITLFFDQQKQAKLDQGTEDAVPTI